VVPGNAETGLEVCTTSSRLAVDGEGPGELNGPSGIATDGRGNVYVGEALNNRVSIFTTGGAFVQAFGRDVVPNNRETGFEACSAQCKVGAIGVGPGRSQIPLGITLDCRGALYVADRFNHRVQRLGAPGTASAPCAGRPAPSSPFSVVSTEVDASNGTATIVVAIPRAGRLGVSGALLRSATKQVRNAGTAQLLVRSTSETVRRLDERGSVRVRATITYTASSGSPRTKIRDIELRKELGS
jgi:hypothetical protein